MNIPPQTSANKAKVGTCPHGLPHGACPVCSGMGGSGGNAKKADRPAGEMTWDECYAIWQQMLKAKALTEQKKHDAQLQANINFAARLENLAQKIANLAEKLTTIVQANKTLPIIIAKPLNFAVKTVITTLNIINNVVIFVQKTITLIQQKFADISDKLNAVFGELKNSIEKKISDRLKDFKKKFKSIFGIYEPLDADDEEKKIEESKRLFEFKNIFKLRKSKKELKNADSKSS